MSVKVSALCWKVRLPATEKLILMRMADFADDQGFNIYPAVQTVADDCGVTTRAVQLTLKKMVRDGVLVMINQGGGRGKATEYAIDLDVMRGLRQSAQAGARQYNGRDDAEKANGENSERGSPFTVENPVKGESHDLNPERDSPHPLESKESGGGGCAGAHACEVRAMVAGLTGLPPDERNLGTVQEWLAKGYDPTQDIYPAVVEALPTAKREIGCFRYFTKAIDRAHIARTNPLPEGASNVHHIRPAAQQHRPPQGRATGRVAAGRLLARILAEGD